MAFEKTLRINMLLDFYGGLLTEKQYSYSQHYFKDDLSLQEIASIYGLSRNGVYDMIQKAVKQLELYEDKLHLLSKHNKRQDVIKKIQNKFMQVPGLMEMINQIEDFD